MIKPKKLLASVQFENEGEIIERDFCCKELLKTTRATTFSTSCLLTQCIGVWTNGAPSIVGSVQGFASRVKENKLSHNNSLLSPPRSFGLRNYWG